MAGIGLRKPFYAIYNHNESAGTVTYSGGGLLAKAVEFSASIETASDNNLYADDGIAESDRSFGGGTVSITTDDLLPEPSATILGITPKEITIGSSETKIKELVYDESMVAPYLGFGVIIPKIKDGIASFRAIVLPKIMFNIPEDAATTKSGTIEWQTPTIEGTILRSDAEGHPWKREVTVSDEATAVAYIKQCLNITDTLDELTVDSVEGTATGKTRLTISPTKTTGNTYKYKIESSVTEPTYNQVCTTGYTEWDGTAEIEATTGHKILIVEVDSASRAKKAGIATITAKA